MTPEAGPTIEVTETIILRVEGEENVSLTPVAEPEPEQTPEEETK